MIPHTLPDLEGGSRESRGIDLPLELTITPRRWQVEALSLWQQHMRGVVSIVTGGGKTIFAYLCIDEFLRNYADGKVVILVPTSALLDQWFVGLQEDFHVDETQISVFSGVEKSSSLGLINLAVINTARDMAEVLSSHKPTMLIVDECHRSGSPANARALKGEYAATLGLSATPERQYDDGFSIHIQPALGHTIYEYRYQEAAADGVITNFQLVNVRVRLLRDEQTRYVQLTRQAAALMQRASTDMEAAKKLTRILQRRATVSTTAFMRIPAAIKLADRERGARTLVFHERVDAANQIAEALRQRHLNVALYHTGIGPSLRRNNLKLFRRGVFDVLVSCRALDEGFNVPETSVAIIAASTASERQRIQRLGRVLRPAPGKNSATIYTLYATDTEHKRLARETGPLAGIAEVEWMTIG